MKARRNSKFAQIGPSTAELGALECHRLIMGKTVSPLFLSCFDRIVFILSGNDDIHKSSDEFEIRPDLTRDYRVSCP